MFYNTVTQAFGISLTDVRAAHPEVSVGINSVVGDFVSYADTPPPSYNEGMQRVVEVAPILVGETWTQQWEVVDFTTEELAEKQAALAYAVQEEVTIRVQQRLDEFAQTRGYDNIVSACSYFASKNPQRKMEGEYCVDLRDSYWDICNGIMNEVLANTRPLPTADEVLAELSAPVWPADPI